MPLSEWFVALGAPETAKDRRTSLVPADACANAGAPDPDEGKQDAQSDGSAERDEDRQEGKV
jgi:hypothetical protein